MTNDTAESNLQAALERVRTTAIIRESKHFYACRVARPGLFSDVSDFIPHGCCLSAEFQHRWLLAGRVDMYIQEPIGHWGVVLWDPWEIDYFHKELHSDNNLYRGDLAIGECKGDTELIVARCDPTRPDFGHVVIALEMDKRKNWPIVAPSLASFIHQYLDSPDKKFWD